MIAVVTASGHMIPIGTEVMISESAAPDVCDRTRQLLPMVGGVMGYGPSPCRDAPEHERLLVVEMPFEFAGGHDCGGRGRARRSIYVTAKHVRLLNPVTVPQSMRDR